MEVYDKKTHIHTLGNNEHHTLLAYDDYLYIIFHGLLCCEFIVPKDIRYNIDYENKALEVDLFLNIPPFMTCDIINKNPL